MYALENITFTNYNDYVSYVLMKNEKLIYNTIHKFYFKQDIEDVAQQLRFAIFQQLGKFDSNRGTMVKFLNACMYSKMLMILRSERRSRFPELILDSPINDGSNTVLDSIQDKGYSIEDLIVSKETKVRLNSLSEMTRGEVTARIIFENANRKMLAEEYGVKTNTITQWHKRNLARLRLMEE